MAGPLGTSSENNVNSFFIRQEDELLSETVDKMFQMDFSESTYSQDSSMSLEDRKAQTIVEKSLKVVDGHYQLDLPFRERPDFPNNRSLASLKMRLRKDQDLYAKYRNGIDEYVNKGYAAKIEQSQSSSSTSPKATEAKNRI